MWLKEIVEGAELLRQYCNYVIEKIVPTMEGICFYTSHFSRVIYNIKTKELIEICENDEIKKIS